MDEKASKIIIQGAQFWYNDDVSTRLLSRGIPLVKRAFDLILVIPLLILLSPLMGLVALLVRIKLGKPVLFRQVRPGLHGELFTLFKFRSMHLGVDSHGNPLPDAKRLTGFGRTLRAFSLDELPELINVLRGELSLVGPRPLLVQYLDRYTPEQARRHSVLPGITGWAQIHGRNALTWEDKFRLDVWYVDHWSLGLDIKILVLTIWKVLRREGINAPGQATAGEFMGTGDK
jgi:lipopolysaccharide/colanic/teichoic acid biosynthesis glycosyltransferase